MEDPVKPIEIGQLHDTWISVSDYLLAPVDDVKYYNFNVQTFDKWNIDVYIDNVNIAEVQHYLIIDSKPKNAFAHWIYECALYVPVFHDLQQIYPNVKLVILENYMYKRQFMEYFSVSLQNDVYFVSDSDVERKSFFQPNNKCFFPPPFFAINYNTINDVYIKYINRFCALFAEKIPKTIDLLFMPRQSKENLLVNNRYYDTYDITKNLRNLDYAVLLETDRVSSLTEQIETVKSSKCIVLMDGSAMYVNGMFAKDSTIIVLDTLTVGQHMHWVKHLFLFKKVTEGNNSVIYIPDKHSRKFYYNDVMDVITGKITVQKMVLTSAFGEKFEVFTAALK